MLKSLIVIGAMIAAPLAHASEIKVSYSPEFEEKLTEDYGLREGERLSEEVREDLERAFAKAGVEPARVDVVIVDATPNRPTFKQLGDEPGLDYLRSIGIGGAAFTGVAYDASGTAIAEIEYDWFEMNIENVVGSATWTDAKRASNRFARKMSKAVAGS